MKEKREMILRAEELAAGYQKKAVVQGVALSLEAGKILTLAGPNGSGKSTLLKTVAAQLSPVGGMVWLTGKPLEDFSGRELAQKLALVLTMQLRTERMTCWDVVTGGRYPYTGRLGLISERDRIKAEKAMEMVGALELRERDFNAISDGQRQRVLLARAICQEPRIIVLDEPTSFLDIKYKIELLSVLRRLAREEKTAILLSLHEVELARKISDEVLCVKDGRILEVGPPERVLSEEGICRLYDLKKEEYRAYYGQERLEHYIETGGKRLRCGYTTGTCAALAAAAAAQLLFSGSVPKKVGLITPKGIPVEVSPVQCSLEQDAARCAVVKDGGDDIDATAGAEIFAEVKRRKEPGILIQGGKGVGRVTKPGLDQPVGEAAINRVPRQMIQAAVEQVMETMGEECGLEITISVPEGEAIAKKTFNPQLGIEGGISIIGTSGIVEPMSLQALLDTKKIELRQAVAQDPKRVVFTPGNYGQAFLREHLARETAGVPVVVCSNFIGELLDASSAAGLEQVLLVGHMGKLVKLAGGIMNTHSRYADCRTELFCAHAAVCGGTRELCQALMEAPTSDACVELLQAADLWEAVRDSLLEAIQCQLDRRTGGDCQAGAVLFSNAYGLLGITEKGAEFLKDWNEKKGDAL